MQLHSHRTGTLGIFFLFSCFFTYLSPNEADAQNNLSLSSASQIRMDRSAHSINSQPGSIIKIKGTVTYRPDSSTIDAATEQTPQGKLQNGLIDPEASGLKLVSSDEANHIYTYEVAHTNNKCSHAGLSSPCVILRLPQIAAKRTRDLLEFRENLSGQLLVEVYRPSVAAITPPIPPPTPYNQPTPPTSDDSSSTWMSVVGVGSAGGLILSIGIIFLARRKRKNVSTPAGRVQTSAGRLRKKLSGDQVKARLLTVVNELADEAKNLVETEKKLANAVENAKMDELRRRHQDLLSKAQQLETQGGEEAGQNEMSDAAQIVEKQIDQCRKWEMQRWRSAARLERIATRLEALETELNDPSQTTQAPKQELLDVLQEELDLARDGEAEANKLLESTSKGNDKDTQAA